HPWMEPEAVAQLAAAGRYLHTYAPGHPLVVVLQQSPGISDDTIGRWWNVAQASLPADEAKLASMSLESPAAAAARTREAYRTPSVVVIQRYNKPGFSSAASLPGARLVGPGVVVINGPGAAAGPAGVTPKANTGAGGILLTGTLVVLILYLCGL